MHSVDICIGNYGYYNEGELHDAWIQLPVSKREFDEFLAKNRLFDSMHEEIYVSDYDGFPIGGCNSLFNQYTSIHELNVLAQVLDDTTECDIEHLESAIECGLEVKSILELCNALLRVDEVPFYSWSYSWSGSDDEMLGYEMAYHNGLFDKLNSFGAIDFFSFERYGRDYTQHFTPCTEGYFDHCADCPDLSWYTLDEVIDKVGGESWYPEEDEE